MENESSAEKRYPSFDWSTTEFEAISYNEARKLTQSYVSPDGKRIKRNAPLVRKAKSFKRKPLIAYDLETTNIAEGTPSVVYVTAFAGKTDLHNGYSLSSPVIGDTREAKLLYLLYILETQMLVKENNRVRWIAWNGNRYDSYFIADALKLSDNWIIHPYLTKSHTLRGFKVKGIKGTDKEKLEFEFLDGMAMTGLDTVSMPLKKFLAMFAPEYQKLTDAIDFETEEFDGNNPQHVAYAERDSEGLWYAMQAANEKFVTLTGNEMQPTMGRAAITYFQAKMPEGIKVWKAPEVANEVLHNVAKRGGYVWIPQQYTGPVWKYDINQAYAAAMRDCKLPCGSIAITQEYVPDLCGLYRCEISRNAPTGVPFYYKDLKGTAGVTDGKRVETWILSNEIEHLRENDWSVDVSEGYVWSEHFNMKDFVDELEKLRFTDPQGPSGPLGLIVKTLGNSGYGKTLERLDGLTLVLAKKCPDGYYPVMSDKLQNVFGQMDEIRIQPYHRPQLGAFITAHVRIVVREAALVMPDAFVYADTDCVAFTRPAPHLKIDPKRYGDWKLETEGKEHTFIAKKVYYGLDNDGKEGKHAKGGRMKELTKKDFDLWFEGKPPEQDQLQRNNFIKTVTGAPMFRTQKRKGTDVSKSKTVKLVGRKFVPV